MWQIVLCFLFIALLAVSVSSLVISACMMQKYVWRPWGGLLRSRPSIFPTQFGEEKSRLCEKYNDIAKKLNGMLPPEQAFYLLFRRDELGLTSLQDEVFLMKMGTLYEHTKHATGTGEQ